jgi:hypothetical protein
MNYGLLFALGTFLVVHLCAAIWFASRMNSTVEQMARAIVRLETDIRELVALDKRLGLLEQSVNMKFDAVDCSLKDLRDGWRLGRFIG